MKYASKTNEKLYESERFITKFNPYTFNCQIGPLTNPRPTSVHALRPSDIEVIGAIGDSLTVYKKFLFIFILNDKLFYVFLFFKSNKLGCQWS